MSGFLLHEFQLRSHGGNNMWALLVLVAMLFASPAFAQQRSCRLDGTLVPHGIAIMAYTQSVVRPPANCSDFSSLRLCENGQFTGNPNAESASCTPAKPIPQPTSTPVPTPIQTPATRQPSWSQVVEDIRHLLGQSVGNLRVPFSKSDSLDGETIITIGAAVFLLLALTTWLMRARLHAPQHSQRQAFPQPEPQREKAKTTPQAQKAREPTPQQTAAEQSPGPGKPSGYEIERPWENAKATSGSSRSDRVHSSSAQPQPSAKHNQSTQFTKEPILTTPPGPAWILKLGLVGMALVSVWFLYWFSYLYRITPGPLWEMRQAFACLALPVDACQFLLMATRMSGGPPYDPLLFWIASLVTAVGFVQWYAARLKK